MNELNSVNGWSIGQGDYKHERAYDDEFVKDKQKQKMLKAKVFLISAILAVGSFVGIMSYYTSVIR